MNRRGFLASLLGLAAAPIAGLLPAKAALPVGSRSTVDWSFRSGPAILNADWMAHVDTGFCKYWYDKPTRTIKFRRYTPRELYKARGTSS